MRFAMEAAGRGAFHPQDIDRLSAAYDAVLCELADSGELTLGPAAALSARDIRTLIARAIIAKALGGERSLEELKVAGLAILRGTSRPTPGAVVIDLHRAKQPQDA